MMKFANIKMLRLVCKSFDRAFAPVVLSRVPIFSFNDDRIRRPLPYLQQYSFLRAGSDSLTHVKSISIYSWKWIFNTLDRSYWRQLPVYEAVPLAIINCTLIYPLVYLLSRCLTPQMLPLDLVHLSARLEARVLRKVLSECFFKLPNVQSVSYTSDWDNKRTMKLLSNILLNLPSLTELQLTFSASKHFVKSCLNQLVTTMQKLHNLRKITVKDFAYCYRYPDWLKAAISHNPNLEHLALDGFTCGHLRLSDLLEGVPADRPLRLRHIRLSDYCYGVTPTVVPHIRSLTSLELCFKEVQGEIDQVWRVLKRERIYLSKISTNHVSLDMCSYLSCYNDLTSLSIRDPSYSAYQEHHGNVLFPLLAQHPNLERLMLAPWRWGRWYDHSGMKASLLRYTNLRELVLCFDDWFVDCPTFEITDFVSQFRKPFVLVVAEKGNEPGGPFDKFVDYCRRSWKPLVQDLGGRIIREQW
ncbi:hypothetical protein AX17_004277 [Amanita inopinata Kibby_2008]|nr:hypothetical protein AX17_004277 [Amanita inopinata Kibby_2008]